MGDLFGKIRHPRKRAFLRAFAACGRVGKAAEIAGIDRDTHYVWLRSDTEYRHLYESVARPMAGDYAEELAWERTEDGWDEPVYQRGAMVGTIRRFDNNLLLEIMLAISSRISA